MTGQRPGYADELGDRLPPPPGAAAPRPARTRVVKKKVAARPRAGEPANRGPVRAAKSPPPLDEHATSRGWVVILATVLLGALVFWQGIHRPAVATQTDTGAIPVASSVAPDRTTLAPPTTVTPSSTIPRPPVTRVPPAELNVLVANGVDPRQVVAGPVANRLKSQQYKVAGTADLAAPADASAIYYGNGLRSEADALAVVLGFPASSVMAMPARPPVPLNGGDILVVIGRDRASTPG